MKEYTVRFEGKVVGARKSPRTYTHAVVVSYVETPDTLWVYGYCGTPALAMKLCSARSGATYGYPPSRKGERLYARCFTVPVEVREIKTRARVRCTGLMLVTRPTLNTDLPWATAKRCLKDADFGLTPGGARCAAHATTDNALIETAAERIRLEASADMERRWNAAHAAEYTKETCPRLRARNACSVHAGVTWSATTGG